MKDKITVVERVYHQQHNAEAKESEVAYTRELGTSDQPYERTRLDVGPEWKPLIPKGCWLEKPGMILVVNHAGERFDVNPSDDELAIVASKILEVGHPSSLPNWTIPAGEGFRGTPTKHESLMIRCLGGENLYSITVYPS